jgi:hypothetical protein
VSVCLTWGCTCTLGPLRFDTAVWGGILQRQRHDAQHETTCVVQAVFQSSAVHNMDTIWLELALRPVMFVSPIFICLQLRFSHAFSLCFAFVVNILLLLLSCCCCYRCNILEVREFPFSGFRPFVTVSDESWWYHVTVVSFPPLS